MEAFNRNAISNSSSSEDSCSNNSFIPTVTQATQEDADVPEDDICSKQDSSTNNVPEDGKQDSSTQGDVLEDDTCSKQDPSSFAAIMKDTAIRLKNKKKKKELLSKQDTTKTSTKGKQGKRLKLGVWYQKRLPASVQRKRNENNKKRARRLNEEIRRNIQVGSLVKKDLVVDIDSKIKEVATVFGTIKRKGRGGRWNVHFENDRCFSLKPSEFEFVSNSSTQNVLSTDKNNKMIIQTPIKNHLLLINKEKKDKDESE